MQPHEEGVGYHVVHLMLAWQQGRSSATGVTGSLSPPPPVFAGAWQEAASLAWDQCSFLSSAYTTAEQPDQGEPSSQLQSCDSLSVCLPRLPWVGEAALLAPPSPASLLLFCKTVWHLLLSCFTAGGFGGGGRLCSKAGNRTASIWSWCVEGGPSF